MLAASSGLYLFGMVLNDLCDRTLDEVERPERPLPAGLVSVPFAAGLATALALAGLACAFAVGWRTGGVAAGLFAAIVGYDSYFKKTFAGPLAMGLCRGLNVLLAMSPAFGQGVAEAPFDLDNPVAQQFAELWWWLVPLAAAVYVAGFTVFARDEALVSRRFSLALGFGLIAAGLGLHAYGISRVADFGHPVWRIAGVMAAFIAFRCGWALHSPSPFRVQRAVLVCILNLCWIAALWLLAAFGRDLALWPVLLLLPALLLGRWINGT